MNMSDSERVASVLDAAGCIKVDNEEVYEGALCPNKLIR